MPAPKTSASPPKRVAVIEVGSTGIRFLIAQTGGQTAWEVLDKGSKPVGLGRDVFTCGRIRREALSDCLGVLHGYQELLASWDIEPENVHVIATSALREADNRDIFIDRIFLRTGFRINVVEEIEENRLMYLAVRFAIRNDRPLFFRSNSIILEVGGGSSELMLLRRGKMAAVHSLRLGTILIDQQVNQAKGSKRYLRDYLEENIRNTTESISSEMDLRKVRCFIAIGSDMRLSALRLGLELNDDCWTMEREAFQSFVERIQGYSVEECVQKLHLPFAEAEGIIPGLLTYKTFLDKTAATEIIVPNVSIREGFLIALSSGMGSELQEEFYSQVIASAISLGRKYRFDEAHASHVANLALKLFDAMTAEHGLDRRARLLLEVAAILHDIGMFIRAAGHQKHSQYLVANSEIFGLHRDDLDIVANTVRYHRRKGPSSNDIAYIALQREDRIVVLKLAAILRVADALDRGHARKVMELNLERRGDGFILRTVDRQDVTMERLALNEKADMFQDVFGLKVMLE